MQRRMWLTPRPSHFDFKRGEFCVGRVVVANALSSDESISRPTAVLSQVQLRNSPISHGQGQ